MMLFRISSAKSLPVLRWTSAWLASIVLLFLLFVAPSVRADVTVSTAASASISADTAKTGGTGAFTTLTGPSIDEGAWRDIQVGTIVLSAPTGWEFDAATTPTVSVSLLAGNAGQQLTLGTTTISASAVTINVSAADAAAGANARSRISVSNLRVRPLSTTFPATNPGSITKSGTSTFAGVSPSTYGTLTEVAGAATQLAFGAQPTATLVGSAISPAVTVLVRDQFGNTVTSATNSITISSSNTGFSGGTLTVSAVSGVATFSAIYPTTVGSSRTLTASASGLSGATSNGFTVSLQPFTLTSPTNRWRGILKGTAQDYINDQQATATDLELVGDNNHAVLYTYYDDNGTVTDTDDFVYYRVRMAGSKSNTSSSFTSGYLFIAFDLNDDGNLNLFMSVTKRTTGEQRISVWSPGSGLNNSPSTTSITAEVAMINLATSPSNFDFSPVTTTNDPSVTDVNLNDAALGTTPLSLTQNDHFVSFKIPFNNTTPAADSLKEIAAAKGIALAKNTVVRYLLATSTQGNSLNSDLSGYQGGTKSTVTFKDQQAFTQPLTVSNVLPLITSDGGGDTASVLVTGGTTAVTTVTATDADGDALQYSISGGANAALFSISASTGALTFLNSATPGTYVVTVKVQDLQNGTPKDANSYDTQTLTVTVPNPADTTPPMVLSVTSPKIDGHYKAGELIPVEVNFDELVVVTGSPTLQLETGTTDRLATYQSGSGSTKLTFLYTVVSGDVSPDLDYTSASGLALNGGTIRDGAGNNTVTTLPTPGAIGSLGANKALVIDTVAPTLASATATGSTVLLQLSDTNPLDALNGPPTGYFTAMIDSVATVVTSVTVDSALKKLTLVLATAATSGQSVSVTYTDPSGDDAFAIQDLAGNDAATFTTGNINATPDTTAPRVINVISYDVSSLLVAGHHMQGSQIPIRVEFDEVVNVTGSPTLTLETGTTDRQATYTGGGGTSVLSFLYTVQAGDGSQDLDCTGTFSLTLNGGTIRDAASNNANLTLPNPGQTNSLGYNNDIVVDTTAPTFVSSKVTGTTLTITLSDLNPLDNINPPLASAFAVTVNSVSRSLTDVAVNSTARQVILTLASAVSSGNTVSVTYTDPTAGNDSLALQDLAGNDAATFTESVQNLSGDITPPLLVSINDNDADNEVYVGASMTYTVTFNEDIDDSTVTLADFNNAGTASVTLNSVQETATPGVFSLSLTANSVGTIIIEIQAGATIADPAGNALDTTSALRGGVDTINVVKAPQTITFGALPDRVYGTGPFTLSATASSGLTVSFTVVSGPATVSGTQMTLTGVGNVTIRASQAGNQYYDPATDVNQTFNVTASVDPAVKMNVRGKGVSVIHNSLIAHTYDGTDFGNTVTGDTVEETITIENYGTGTLNLTGTPKVAVSGTNAGDFVVTQPAASSVAAAGSVTFKIAFTPGADGSRAATVTITNNSPDRAPFVFAIGGTGVPGNHVDLTMQGGRVQHLQPGSVLSPITAGTFVADPYPNANHVFQLVSGIGDTDNYRFRIDGNVLKLEETPNINTRPVYHIRVRVTSPTSATAEKVFSVVVMNLLVKNGDFFIADRGPYSATGTIVLFDQNGQQQKIFTTTIKDPYEITTDGDGNVVVANYLHNATITAGLAEGGIYKIDVITGAQTHVASGSPFVTPLGVKVESSGSYIVADADAYNYAGGVFRVNPGTGSKTLLATGFYYIQGLAIAPNGDIYVSDVGTPKKIIKINPANGVKTTLASGGNLQFPVGMAVEADGSSLLVADPVAKKLIRVNLTSGAQSVISSDSIFTTPTQIAIENNGNYLVTDGKDANAQRKLIRIDKVTGKGTLVDSNGFFEQPRGVTIAK